VASVFARGSVLYCRFRCCTRVLVGITELPVLPCRPNPQQGLRLSNASYFGTQSCLGTGKPCAQVSRLAGTGRDSVVGLARPIGWKHVPASQFAMKPDDVVFPRCTPPPMAVQLQSLGGASNTAAGAMQLQSLGGASNTAAGAM
jgi:hypothetical protein